MLRLHCLLLICALLLLSATHTPAEAARPTRYVRAKMHGRVYTHRPYYKLYKGRKASKKHSGLFRKKAAARPARPQAQRRHRLTL